MNMQFIEERPVIYHEGVDQTQNTVRMTVLVPSNLTESSESNIHPEIGRF